VLRPGAALLVFLESAGEFQDAGKVEDGDAATARTDLDGDGARRRELLELRTVVGDDKGLAGASPEVSGGQQRGHGGALKVPAQAHGSAGDDADNFFSGDHLGQMLAATMCSGHGGSAVVRGMLGEHGGTKKKARGTSEASATLHVTGR
jgi:hypothetical protein